MGRFLGLIGVVGVLAVSLDARADGEEKVDQAFLHLARARACRDAAQAAEQAASIAKAEVLRLWALRTKLDGGNADHQLDEMVALGLRGALEAFYEKRAAADPASLHPARVLARLRAPK